MTTKCGWTTMFLLFVAFGARGQEAGSGVSLPVTISGNARYSGSSTDGNSGAGGFRALASPGVQLGSHWFGYAVLGVESKDYQSYSSGFDDDSPMRFTFLQGYAGYRAEFKSATLLLKGGRLVTAFGHYPLDYDDAKAPLIDPPPLYSINLPLRPDQLPCNLANVVWQSYDAPVDFDCGGSTAERYGLVPATIYGIPGLEAQLSWNRLDARLQMTNSSPANPQSLTSGSQFVQFSGGAGYSVRGGLHVGVSGYRGPYLERTLAGLIPAGRSLQDFKASGFGVDAQWSGGPWSAEGEWQHFRFDEPGFVQSPSMQGAYVQVKRIISPRLFAAVRSTLEQPGGATDGFGAATSQIDAHREIEELGIGYRISRVELLKVGVTFSEANEWWLGSGYWPSERRVGLQVQLVTSFAALSKGFH